MSVLNDLIIAWLSSLFLYTGVDKLSRLTESQFALEPYRFLLRGVTRPAAVVMPFVEVGVGVGLLTPLWHEATAGALLSGIAFAVVSGSALRRKVESGCGCVASTSGRLGRTTFARAITITAAASILFSTRTPGPVPTTVVIIAVVLAGLALTPGVRDLARQSLRHHRHADVALADIVAAVALLEAGTDVRISDRVGELYVGHSLKSALPPALVSQ